MSHPLFSLCSKVGRGFSFRYLLCVKRGLWPFGSDSWIDWLYLDVHLKNCILWIGIKMPSQIRSTANAEVLAVWTCSITIYLDVLFPPWITISIYFPGMWGGWTRVTAEILGTSRSQILCPAGHDPWDAEFGQRTDAAGMGLRHRNIVFFVIKKSKLMSTSLSTALLLSRFGGVLWIP